MIFLKIIYGMLVLLNHSNKLFGAPLKFAPGIRAFLPPHSIVLDVIQLSIINDISS